MLNFSAEVVDSDWGCAYQEVADSIGITDVKACFVKVTNIDNFAEQLGSWVLDTSWMMDLDKGVRRQYDYTVKETAKLLVEIFRSASGGGKIGEEFGELMVSIGSARGLEQIFRHAKIPIAELWKPQAKQNEGFDFHTVCTGKLVNFGEAKFSSSKNPHGPALEQASRFISEQKHLRDRAHLVNFVTTDSIGFLDDDKFGVIAAFSINSPNPLVIFQNALETALIFAKENSIKNLYLVGVGE
ncbi:hypothetical protein [Pseudomonas sp. URMO17WK12:I11]|uniref:hypothetical protein n=1 Tax=Pseudomonas sp. URMO17WK12:I11 TaxID=1283291 RepID=UPI00071F0409|nr:hypothetical protein [Pseudomonas sp. URMO17WK12:I11]CRL50734.1 hypothetical protein PSHI_38920 [Pseudomonas sp. URMO17WK12:I11]